MSLPDTIAVCVITQEHGMQYVMHSIETFYGNVDEIVVQSEDDLNSYSDKFKEFGVKRHFAKWEDSFSEYKNESLRQTKCGWAISLDHDEIPTKELAEGLRTLVKESNHATIYDLVRFMSRGVIDGVPSELPGEGKPLLQANYKNPFHGLCHNHLRAGLHKRMIASDLVYEHHKTSLGIMRAATRNIFLGGGGDNFRDKSGIWSLLRDWCSKNGIMTYRAYLDYLDAGNVDAWLKDWMKTAYNIKWHDDEYRAIAIYYYKIHPSENDWLDVDKHSNVENVTGPYLGESRVD